MKESRKTIAIILSVLMCLTLLSACNDNKNPDAPPSDTEDGYVMQIVAPSSLCAAPVFLVMELGYLDDLGVNYEFVRSDSSAWDMMAANKSDIAFGLMPTFVQRIANGFEIYVATGIHYGCGNMVATEASGIQSIGDLAGRVVGVPMSMGSDPAILLQRMLYAYGIEISDVDIRVFNTTELGTAMQEGFIEGFISWDPYVTIVSQQEGNRMIYNQATHELTADEFCCVLGFRPGFANEHPALAEKYVEALTRACAFIVQNPVEAAKICYEGGYIADSNFELNGMLLAEYNYVTNYSEAKTCFVKVADDLIDLGIISVNTTGSHLADIAFVNAGNID